MLSILTYVTAVLAVLGVMATRPLAAQSLSGVPYDIGNPVLRDIWVDPSAGNDANSGDTRGQALRTVTAAWGRIPVRQALTTGYRIRLLPGTYAPAAVPGYWESRWGSAAHPVIVEAVDGAGTVALPSLNIFDCRYLYLIGIRSTAGGGDVVHCERCSYFLLRQVQIVGTGNPATYSSPQETLKVNQSRNVYIEDSDIAGAFDNAVDFVAVQYGHIVRSRIHGALDWCVYTKGGSAQILVEGNEIYDCGTGGYTAGQGTGFEFMTAPWLQYEAYDIKFLNNVIHDTAGAAFGVNGGYNILLAHNTATRIGTRSHVLEFVYGGRSCDGDAVTCTANRAAGGWGPVTVGQEVLIPNRNVYAFNNVIYNPPGVQSRWQQFTVPGPVTAPAGSNMASPLRADDNLLVRGNWIWNGPSNHPLGVAGTLGAAIAGSNTINQTAPTLTADYRLTTAGPAPAAIPDFSGAPLAGIPAGVNGNLVPRDRDGRARTQYTPGAYELAGAGPVMTATPAILRFVQARGGPAQASIPLRVHAVPDASLTVASSAAWLGATPTALATPGTVQVSATAGALADGSYQANLTLSSGPSSLAVPASLVVLTPGASSQIFNDVPAAHPWIDAIFLLNRFGITVGCRNTPLAYCPADTTTQAQMAAFVVRAVAGEQFTFPQTPYFSDLGSNNSLFPYVQKMRELGINLGCGAGQFCPNAAVTRGQMATYLARALFGESFPFPSNPRFSDVPAANPLFGAVQKIWELGITQGCTSTRYCPDDLVTREQMAVFLSRAFFAYQRLTP